MSTPSILNTLWLISGFTDKKKEQNNSPQASCLGEGLVHSKKKKKKVKVLRTAPVRHFCMFGVNLRQITLKNHLKMVEVCRGSNHFKTTRWGQLSKSKYYRFQIFISAKRHDKLQYNSTRWHVTEAYTHWSSPCLSPVCTCVHGTERGWLCSGPRYPEITSAICWSGISKDERMITRLVFSETKWNLSWLESTLRGSLLTDSQE